jgi:antitoxin ParD1/3/4
MQVQELVMTTAPARKQSKLAPTQPSAAEAELWRVIDEAEASGVSEKTPDQIWDEAEADYLKRHG